MRISDWSSDVCSSDLWDAWEDPFRLTMDAYWKYQAEKERKLYAIVDAFAQSNGHLTLSDARYINTVKLFVNGFAPLEYMSHRGFAHIGRQFRGVGPRVACMMQSLGEMRHSQTRTAERRDGNDCVR